MNKASILLLMILTLVLTACSGNGSSATAPAGNAPGGGSAGALSVPMQVALGTLKLDKTKDAVTAEQAKELLPMWETLQQLEGSDTAATQEKDALVSQIQETMTKEQMQAIAALGLTSQDMFSIMQSQVQTFTGTQNNGATQSSGSSNNNRRNFGGGGGGFFVEGGGPPPDAGGGGFAGANVQGQGSRTQSNRSTNSTQNSNRQFTADPNRLPTPLIQAVIVYLKTKTGAS
jgi:hypothetical protein